MFLCYNILIFHRNLFCSLIDVLHSQNSFTDIFTYSCRISSIKLHSVVLEFKSTIHNCKYSFPKICSSSKVPCVVVSMEF